MSKCLLSKISNFVNVGASGLSNTFRDVKKYAYANVELRRCQERRDMSISFCFFLLFLGEARRGEAEAEAEAEARRRRRRGEATAAPRRPRAAGINDAFLRPHANFQFFCSKSCF